jgi:hypothetical protein
MPYKEQWKRTEAVRRFRRRQREQRLQSRNIWNRSNPSTASQTGSFAQTKKASGPGNWLLLGISVLGLLAMTGRINSPRM